MLSYLKNAYCGRAVWWNSSSALRFLSYLINSFLRHIEWLAKNQQRVGDTFSSPFWYLCQKLCLSLVYVNKPLTQKSSERSSLITGPGLNSFPPEAKSPGIFCGSAATFHPGGSSGILQDKVRMLGALVLCSPSEHVFCCTLLSLQCVYVNDWYSLCKASKEPCSVVPQ